MKILVTGASGLLGLNLSLLMTGTHTIIGVDRSKLGDTPFELLQADLLEAGVCSRLINQSRPDAVIHTAANADVDSCELDPEGARRLNAELPGELAGECAKHDIPLVHISTDAIFDGTKEGIYTETDEPNPLGVYAQTKLDGERAVLSVGRGAVVARVNFYGWSLSGRRSLAEFFVNNLQQGNAVNGFTDVIFCPMWVNHLGDTLVAILAKELHGLYHVVSPQGMSKYQFGIEIARRFGMNEYLVQPKSVESSGLAARRSHNLWLSTNKLSTDLGRSLPDFSTGLVQFYQQYQQGYPQKMRSYQQF